LRSRAGPHVTGERFARLAPSPAILESLHRLEQPRMRQILYLSFQPGRGIPRYIDCTGLKVAVKA
jgi:hypothetical protein